VKVVVAGLVARFPMGGVAWDYLQYAAGFAALGCDVFYLEDTGEYCYNPAEQTFTADATWNADYLGRTAERFGLAGRWCLRNWDGTCLGASRERLLQVLSEADAFVNISGTCWLRDEYRGLRMRKVFIDTDPGYNQVWIAQAEKDASELARKRERVGGSPGPEGPVAKLAGAVERIRAHDVHFTFAENAAGADAALPPTPGISWRPTRQPIALDLLKPAPIAEARPFFTTVMSWKPHEYELEWEDRRFGGKARAMERYMGVPGRFGRRFEVAVAGKAPIGRLEAAGFRIADPSVVSADVDAYVAYLAGSRGEWSVAKEVYTAMRTGWFSCRSACYLALGRPVIVEDTGFRPYYPCGRAIFPFSSEDEVGAALEAVDRDPQAASRAAREVADACFDARTVLRPMLE
jgi:hypothetical protein